MKKQIFTLLAVACCGILSAKSFTGKDLILKGNAKQQNNVIRLDGKTGFIELAGTENWNIGKKGLSIAASFKFHENSGDRRSNDSFDMFFSKATTPFIFGRYGHLLYSNIKDAAKNGKMDAVVYGSLKPETGVWYHIAIVYEYYNDHAQGDIGYYTTMYVNGNRIGKGKHSFLEPVKTNTRIDVGKGWGGPWFFCGEVAEIHAEQTVWNEAYVADLVDQSKFVKAKTSKKVNPALKSFKAASPAGKWALSALNRLEPARGTALAKKFSAAFAAKKDAAFLKAFPKNAGLALIVKPQVLILSDMKSDMGEPVLGVYDRISQKPVLEDKLLSWNFTGNVGKTKIQGASADYKYTVKNFSDKGFTAVWQGTKPVKFTAEANYGFLNDGISASLKIQNQTPNFVLKQVVFPETRTNKWVSDDAFLYPYQCGVVIKDPTRNSFKSGQFGRYPGNSMTMQFTAYYGGGRGVFLGWEDPNGTVKNMQATGKRGGMEFFWTQSVAIPLNKLNGGNSYASPGKVVFKVYSGEWFEACMIHKQWALSEAVWKVSVPRKDTPAWFRNIPVDVNYSVTNYETAMTRYAQVLALRNYLQVPIYCSADAWYDVAKGGWPHFYPRSYIPAIYKDLAKAGCVVEPYTDARLWDIKDGPYRKSDWEYSTKGKKFAVIQEDGKIPMEHYTNSSYAVMCPVAKGWQEELIKLSKFMATLTPAIYHDQVMTAQGFPCFCKDHGHALNDPAAWIGQGYRPLYQNIRKALPGVIHTSEEVSEPYLDLFDGGHIWRWTFDGQVPAFQSVYGGRMQYMALVYDSHGKGEYASNFVKMGNSLVNGLKIGKFETHSFYNADNKRLFMKKMVTLRMALNDYFNNGDMLAPIRFAKPIPTMTTGWSTSSKELEKVTMPKVVSNSYKLGNNIVYMFVNTTSETLTVQPKIAAQYLCMEGASQAAAFRGSITLGAYKSALAVKGAKAEAEKLQKVMKQISTFTPGESFDSLVRFKSYRKIALKPGEWAGLDKMSGYYNCSKSVSGTHIGNMVDGSLISYGEVDFGKNKATEITMKLAVPEAYEGGSFSVLTGPNQNISQVVGTCVLTHGSGSWTTFKEYKCKLSKPLTGKCNIIIKTNRHASGNFAGWKYN